MWPAFPPYQICPFFWINVVALQHSCLWVNHMHSILWLVTAENAQVKKMLFIGHVVNKSFTTKVYRLPNNFNSISSFSEMINSVDGRYLYIGKKFNSLITLRFTQLFTEFRVSFLSPTGEPDRSVRWFHSKLRGSCWSCEEVHAIRPSLPNNSRGTTNSHSAPPFYMNRVNTWILTEQAVISAAF